MDSNILLLKLRGEKLRPVIRSFTEFSALRGSRSTRIRGWGLSARRSHQPTTRGAPASPKIPTGSGSSRGRQRDQVGVDRHTDKQTPGPCDLQVLSRKLKL